MGQVEHLADRTVAQPGGGTLDALQFPDRPGNNRLDTMTNLLTNGGVGMLFFIPGFDESLRINGVAVISHDAALRDRFAVNGKPALAVVRVTVDEVYFHCGKALKRSRLWDPSVQRDRKTFTTHGRILAEQTKVVSVQESEAYDEQSYRERPTEQDDVKQEMPEGKRSTSYGVVSMPFIQRLSHLALAIVLCAVAPASMPGLSDAADHADLPSGGGQHDRHPRARARRRALPRFGPERHRRRSSRRRRPIAMRQLARPRPTATPWPWGRTRRLRSTSGFTRTWATIRQGLCADPQHRDQLERADRLDQKSGQLAQGADRLRSRKGDRSTYSSGGNGTTHHLSGALMAKMAQLNSIHVPYRGAPQGINAVVSDEVTFGFFNTPNVVSLVRDGAVKGLAVTSLQRSPLLPNLPTMSEAGLEGYETTVSFGLVAPAGTPTAIVARLHDAAAKVLADKELQAKLQTQGFDLLPIGLPEDYAAQIKADIAKWVPIVKASGASTN